MRDTLIALPLLLMALACSPQGDEPAVDLAPTSDSIPNVQDETTENDSGFWNVQEVQKSFLLGKTDMSSDERFSKLRQYCSKEIYVLKEVEEAFLQMAQSAEEDGIKLLVISGGRTFNHQRSIWNRKWDSKEGADSAKAWQILRFSSMPGTSRHHWGTDVDINSLENEYFEFGEGLRVYNWLVQHASEYGFYQPYTDKKIKGRSGYEMEKWHWSFAPISVELLKLYNQKISYSDIQGFPGSEVAKNLKMIEWYVNGVEMP